VSRDVVERELKPEQLRVQTVGCVHEAVQRAEYSVVHAIVPAIGVERAVRALRLPRAVRDWNQLGAALVPWTQLAEERDPQFGRGVEHLKSEQQIRATLGSNQHRRLYPKVAEEK